MGRTEIGELIGELITRAGLTLRQVIELDISDVRSGHAGVAVIVRDKRGLQQELLLDAGTAALVEQAIGTRQLGPLLSDDLDRPLSATSARALLGESWLELRRQYLIRSLSS